MSVAGTIFICEGAGCLLPKDSQEPFDGFPSFRDLTCLPDYTEVTQRRSRDNEEHQLWTVFQGFSNDPVSIQRPTSSERRNQFGCMSHLSNMVFVMGIAFPLAAEATQDACRNHRIGPNGCIPTQRPSEIPKEGSVPLCCTKTASHWSLEKKRCPILWKPEEDLALIRVSEKNFLAHLGITAKSGAI